MTLPDHPGLPDSGAEFRAGARAGAATQAALMAEIADHDLREPACTIRLYAEMLAAGHASGLDERGRFALSTILGEARRMQDMVEGLRILGEESSRELRIERVDAGALLGEVLQGMAGLEGFREARFEIGPLPAVLADRAQLALVLDHLTANAILYRSSGAARIIWSAAGGRDEWVLAIEDRGRGINPALRDRLFRPFKRLGASPPGAGPGIGLALCRGILDRHGGRIWAEDAPGGGAVFRFALPDDPGKRP